MPSLLSDLSKTEQQQLLEDLNYLNTEEIKAFCNKHSIPYSIWIETEDGGRRKTQDDDRKGVILNRIRQFLMTGKVFDATCFPASVVCCDKLPPKTLFHFHDMRPHALDDFLPRQQKRAARIVYGNAIQELIKK